MIKRTREKREGERNHRLSVSISHEQYAELLEIANQNRVSVAWVVREAIERLLRDQHPLFQIQQTQ